MNENGGDGKIKTRKVIWGEDKCIDINRIRSRRNNTAYQLIIPEEKPLISPVVNGSKSTQEESELVNTSLYRVMLGRQKHEV